MAVPGRPLPDPHLVTLATRIQGHFLYNGQSLADPQTAAVWRTSLSSVQMILQGALATGLINQDQHATLSGMLDAAEAAPDVL